MGTLCGALEIATRDGGSVLPGLLLAASLCGAVGALAALLVHVMGERRILAAALLVLPVPIYEAREIHWAIGRASDLSLMVGAISVWIASLAAGAVAGGAVFLAFDRAPISKRLGRRSAVVLSVGALLVATALSLAFCQARAPFVARIVLHAVAAGVAILLLSPKLRKIARPIAAVASLAALAIIPGRYTGLCAAAAAVALGSAVLSLEAFGAIVPTRPIRSPTIAISLAGAILALAAAHLIVTRLPGSWLEATGTGLVTELVRAGRALTDFDRDGHGVVFGQRDCAPFSSRACPGKHEVPGDALDENCLAGPAPAGECARVRAAEAINPRPRPWRGDIVLLLVDTLRAADAFAIRDGQLASMEAAGISFTRAYSTSSFTAFALLGVFSWRLAPNATTTWFGAISGVSRMPRDSLAPLLVRAGYSTALVGGSLPRENRYFGPDAYGAGFETAHLMAMGADPSDVTRAAASVFGAMSAGKPRFLYVHVMALHEPQADHAAYLRTLSRIDQAMGTLRSAVGPGAMWIVLADHGDEYGEHGGLYHASTLYDEQLRVPLVVTRPDLAPRREAHVTALRSLGPTILAMVDPASAPAGPGPYLCLDVDGCRDMPVPAALEMPTIHLHGLVTGTHKVVRDLDRGQSTAFDLTADPKERAPMTPAPPDLEEELTAWEEDLFGPRDAACFWPYAPSADRPRENGATPSGRPRRGSRRSGRAASASPCAPPSRRGRRRAGRRGRTRPA
jgi:hypothetical protein